MKDSILSSRLRRTKDNTKTTFFVEFKALFAIAESLPTSATLHLEDITYRDQDSSEVDKKATSIKSIKLTKFTKIKH